MLLNYDIQKKIIQMILHFQKEINVIMYIIEKKNFNHFIWTKSQ
jgi:5-methylcytosine-specific restriction endonuclease McrBC GTP-binding regulatory subunit McrB